MKVLHLDVLSQSSHTAYLLSLVREQQNQGVHAQLVMINHRNKQSHTLYQNQIKAVGALILTSIHPDTLLRNIDDTNIDIIHVHSFIMLPLAATLAQRLSIPYVFTYHGLGINHQQFHPYLGGCAAIICTSARVADSISLFAPKIYIIPYGVDVKEIMPGPKTCPLKIALVAYINQGKDNALRHFCKAVDLLENVEFYVISNMPPLSKTAIYLGPATNSAELLAKTDIVVGTGRAIREGLASGNAALIMGSTFDGLITPEKVARQSYLDISGLTGSAPCYKTIFYDLAKLTQNVIYLRQLQTFGRELAEKEFDQITLTQKQISIYQDALNSAQTRRKPVIDNNLPSL